MKIEHVKIEQIKKNEWNPQKQTEREFRALVKSIKERGQLLPIRVREVEKGWEIIGGYHTYLALKETGAKEAWIINEGKLSDKAAKIRSLQDNIHGQAAPIELARLLVDLGKEGENMEKLAEAIGKPAIELVDMVKLLGEDEAAKKLEAGLAMPHLVEMTFITDPDAKATVERFAISLTAWLEQRGAKMVKWDTKINKAKETVNLVSVGVTEPQREVIERAINSIIEGTKLEGGDGIKRGRALELLCAEWLSGAELPKEAQRGKSGQKRATRKPPLSSKGT